MTAPSPSLRLSVIGIGYLGLTHAVCMADLGHQVLAIDIDLEKLSKAARGEVPFFEPELEPLLHKNLDSGSLNFTSSYAEIADHADAHFLCVGTPQSENGAADLSYVNQATEALAPHLTRRCLVIGKSTVPVGTAREIASKIRTAAPAGDEVELAWNPEFLREGFAVQDSLTPDRLVFGVESSRADSMLRRIYAKPLAAGIPGLGMDLETAELVKVSANAFLATKISFINAMAEVCENVGANVIKLADALRYDERIGRRYLVPGLGFGGGCLPKDIRAFRSTAMNIGATSLGELLDSVSAINSGRRTRVVELARNAVGGSLEGQRVGVLGVSFKPDSDDVRDSPSLDVCERLLHEGALVTVHDPVAMPSGALISLGLRQVSSILQTAEGADVILHMTEWAEYQAIDPIMLASVVAKRRIIDARCALDAELWRAAGWSFQMLGQGDKRIVTNGG
jgi:UDPglucose 6-dehydrogenase